METLWPCTAEKRVDFGKLQMIQVCSRSFLFNVHPKDDNFRATMTIAIQAKRFEHLHRLKLVKETTDERNYIQRN